MSKRFTYYGGSAILTPSQIFGANYYDHWDFTNPSQLTLSGSAIDQCDSYTSARALTAGSSSRPTLVASQINGYSIARFTSPQRMGVASSNNLYNFLHNSSGGAIFYILKQSVNAGANSYFNNVADSASVGIYSASIGNAINAQANRGVTSTFAFRNYGAVGSNPYSQFNFIVQVFDSANTTIADRGITIVNGGTPIKNNSDTLAPSSANASFNLAFGGVSGGSINRFEGDLVEAIIINAIPTSTQITQLQAYFENKFGTFPVI